jgi:hypothetical protein
VVLDWDEVSLDEEVIVRNVVGVGVGVAESGEEESDEEEEESDEEEEESDEDGSLLVGLGFPEDDDDDDVDDVDASLLVGLGLSVDDDDDEVDESLLVDTEVSLDEVSESASPLGGVALTEEDDCVLDASLLAGVADSVFDD